MRAVGNAMAANQQLAGGSGGGAVYRTIAIGAGLLSLCLVGFIIAVMVTGNNPIQIGGASPRQPDPPGGSAGQAWVVAAPGRVEPRSGLIRLGTSIPGRVDAVLVNQNDKVSE